MIKKRRIKAIGIIAEDDSDYESLKILIKRITEKNDLTFKKAIGHGCGKLRRKAASYATNLSRKGCNLIILVHDLDKNKLEILQNKLEGLLKDSPAKNNFICIPIEEIEGWFLSDPLGIKSVFQLDRAPKIRGNPEEISSPKEKLEKIVINYSNKSKMYINTRHNMLLAETVNITDIKNKCRSFLKLYDYLNLFHY